MSIFFRKSVKVAPGVNKRLQYNHEYGNIEK